MKAITSFISTIGDTLSTIFEFVIDFFKDIAYIVKLTAEFVAKIPSYFDWLPPSVLAIIVSAFAIVVIYKVLGREG